MNKNMYHRYLKIPFAHIKPVCFSEQPSKMRGTNWHEEVITQEHWDIRFVEWLNNYNLKPSNICEAFYNSPSGGGLPIHNDTPDISNAVNINFTWGPLTSTTRWWKIKNESLIQLEKDNTEYHKEYLKGISADIPQYKFLHADEKECDLVYEQVINKPSLMNVGQLHSTYNPHFSECRWTLSYHILSQKDGRHIQFDEALEIFKDVAYE